MTFDPTHVELAMVAAGVLGPRGDEPTGALGPLEDHFTEFDERKYALWRISTARQFSPTVLRKLTDDDLLYLAGQSSEGYQQAESGWAAPGNKVAQNSERSRIELARRATLGAYRRTIGLAVFGAVLGVLATWVGTLI
jgi:hypothetical protein